MSGLKLAATAIAAGLSAEPALQAAAPHIVHVPVLGVPIAVVAAALAGAGLSLFFGDPIPTRKALFGQTFTAAIFGTCVAVLLAEGMSWTWAQTHVTMFALMTSAMLRWFLPGLIERISALIREFKISFPKIGASSTPKTSRKPSPKDDAEPPPRPRNEGVEP